MDSSPPSRKFGILSLLCFLSSVTAESILQISENPQYSHRNCDSWKFSVETNDAGAWTQIPANCLGFVKEYMTGDRYESDLQMVAEDSLAFAKSVRINGDGKDAWIFDIDETLISNLPYYALHGFGSEVFDERSFNAWVKLAEAPALQASLKLYKELENLGFKIFLITGRAEYQRTSTEKNLNYVGYTYWDKLILRGVLDQDKKATYFKSEKRKELEDGGFKIHGSSGDQWSDLLGFALATRSFKLPNPMYYIG